MEPSASTRLLAVIGDPVEHSLSPAMHNAALRALGIDAVYVALRCPAPALAGLLASCAAVGAAGNITVPHKEAAERALTRKTELCVRVGACNVFWPDGGELVGDNTDVAGVLAALAELGVAAGRWLLVGTGGAARAVAVAAAGARAELRVRSRTPERARDFVAWARERGASAQVAGPPLDADVVINASPLGLRAADPVPLHPGEGRWPAALDLVYAPGETRWVRALRAAGVRAHDGREMLLWQGAAAFERFFPETDPPLDVMRAALARALEPH